MSQLQSQFILIRIIISSNISLQALGRLKTSDQFKNATSEDQATLLSEHQRVYSNEKLQEELDRAKTSWEKEHGNIPEDRSKWSSIEQYFGKRFNANDDFDPLKSAFITAVGPIPEDPLPNETDEEREARETLLLSRDATIRMLERLKVEAKKGKGGEDKEEEDDDESIAMADLGEGEEEEDDVLESDIGEDEEDDIPFQVNEEPKDMKKWKQGL